MKLSKKIQDRISFGIKKYQPILVSSRDRDVSESDTVVIIADILTDVFGYKKYEEITTEFAIRNTFCDLAIKFNGELRFLIEAKAIGIDLKENHVKQAIDYGANQGIEWVILTNGARWILYKIHFKQPIDKTVVFDIDITSIKHNDKSIMECFGILCRENYSKTTLADFFIKKQAVSKYSIAQIILGDAVFSTIKKEVKKVSNKIKIEDEYLYNLIKQEILKRDLLEGEDADKAYNVIKKLSRKSAKQNALKKIDATKQDSVKEVDDQ